MTPFFDSFVFGAANSVHCACMCGPLSVAFGGGAAVAAYHGGRGMAYTAVGLLLGATGTVLGSDRVASPTATVAFVLAAGLLLLAVVGERGVIRVPGIGKVVGRVTAAGRSMTPVGRALLFGICTPLLPCGLLWSACAGAAVAGSAAQGGAVMAGFAAGSLPLLALAQHRAPALARRFSPRALARVQKAALLLAAGVLLWRGLSVSTGGSCH